MVPGWVMETSPPWGHLRMREEHLLSLASFCRVFQFLFSWPWLPVSSRYSLEDSKGDSLFSGSFSLARESSLESEKSSPSLLLMGYVRSWLLEHQLTVWTDNVSGADSDLLHRHQQPSSEGSGGGFNWKCNLETEKAGTGKKNSPRAPS